MKKVWTFISVPLLLLTILLPHADSAQTGATPHPDGDATVSPKPNEGAFLLLSDIHLDPLTGAAPYIVEQLIASPVERWQTIFQSSRNQEISPNGGDTSYALLASAIDAAKHSGTQYDYIIITGDFLGHDFLKKYQGFRSDGSGYQNFVIKTMVFVNRMIQQAFPATPVYETLGNNDSVEADYGAPGQPLLAALAKEWKVVAANRDATRDFIAGGYYAVPHPFVSSQKLIVMDTAFWSNRYENSSRGPKDPGTRELAWLNLQLDRLRAEHKTAALLMHIPPTIDPFKSAREGNCGNPTSFWKNSYLDSFLAILSAHKAQLRDGYAGHTHIDDFLVVDDTDGVPYFQTHITPSISPNDRNHPAFETALYDRTTGGLVDYAATYLKMSSGAPGTSPSVDWEPEYDFRRASHFPNYSPASLQTIALLIRSNDFIRQRFLDFYAARVSANLAEQASKSWLSYSCAQTELTPEGFGKCACPRPAAANN